MTLSVFDLFKIGIGPSSSHTVGPMRAARTFVAGLAADGLLERTAPGARGAVRLARRDRARARHATRRCCSGLEGEDPETVDTDRVEERVARIRAQRRLRLAGAHEIDCDPDRDLVLHRRRALPYHPNGMHVRGLRRRGAGVCAAGSTTRSAAASWSTSPRPARTGSRPTTRRCATRSGPAAELLGHCQATGLAISGVMLANELSWRTEPEVRAGLLRIWQVMQECVTRGCSDRTASCPAG